MRTSVSIVKLFLLVAALLLQGCAFQQWKVNHIAGQLRNGSPQQALLSMQNIQAPPRDQAQYLLNLGMLKHLNGDIQGSSADLQAAKELMEQLQAVSVREVVGASTVNETLRSYRGTPSERVMVQQLLALNYLAQGDLDGARVEMLQADVLMQEPAYKDSLSGQLSSARFLAGVVYELGKEWDDALISYRKAAGIMDERGQQLPKALQDSLLRMTLQVGLKDEYREYVQRFGREATLLKSDEVEVIVLYWQGVVSAKQQSRISVFSPSLGHHISLAVPAYAEFYTPSHSSLLSMGQYQASTQILDDVELLAREDLSAEMPKITATTLLRAVAKHKAVKKAREQDQQNGQGGSLLGFITDVAATLTEVADVRSWNTLPASIQVARISLPAGQYPITLGRAVRTASSEPAVVDHVALKNKQKALILGHSVSSQLFVYKTR